MRILRIACCVFLLSWIFGDVAYAEDYMAKGRDLENRTLYGPAMAEYQRAIKETPEHAAEAHYRIGILSNQLGNTEGGMQEFRAALQADPNHVEARKAVAAYYMNRGANARQQQRLPDAIQDLQEAVKFDPDSSTPHVELGMAYQESGRLTEAVQEYQAAVTADPKDLTAQVRLGQGYNAQKQYAQATIAFKAVLEGNPNSADAYAGLGVAYAHQGQAEEAKKAFDMAIRKHLVAGRRDLAMKVKQDSDALLKPSPAAQETGKQ